MCNSTIVFGLNPIPLIANEQSREDARLRGGSLIEPCAIVPGAEKISNRCNMT